MEVVLIIILVLWLLPKVLRWWVRWWLGRKLGAAAPRQPRRKEGEVTIEDRAAPQKTVARDVGDYVEFEEVGE